MDKRRWSVIYRDTRAWRRLRNFLVEAERTDFSNRTPPLAERGVAPSWPWQVQGRSQPIGGLFVSPSLFGRSPWPVLDLMLAQKVWTGPLGAPAFGAMACPARALLLELSPDMFVSSALVLIREK